MTKTIQHFRKKPNKAEQSIKSIKCKKHLKILKIFLAFWNCGVFGILTCLDFDSIIILCHFGILDIWNFNRSMDFDLFDILSFRILALEILAFSGFWSWPIQLILRKYLSQLIKPKIIRNVTIKIEVTIKKLSIT